MFYKNYFWITWAVALAIRIFIGLHLDLTPDEAYYWEYARRLDWSYYDHPPMVGYLIAIGRLLFGDTVVAVRFPAWIGIAVVSWLIFVIGRDHLGSVRTGYLASTMIHLTPSGLALGFITTPDVPLAVFWISAVVAFLHLLKGPQPLTWSDSNDLPDLSDSSNSSNSLDSAATKDFTGEKLTSSAPNVSSTTLDTKVGTKGGSDSLLYPWLMTGLALGFGAMSKYMMIFLVPAIAATLLTFPRPRLYIGSRHFWAMVGLAALGTVPVLIWNVQHDWVSIRFQLNHGLKSSDRSFWANLGEFIGGQMITLGPLLFIVLWSIGLTKWYSAWKAGDERRFFLAVSALPMLCFFAYNGTRSKVEANWPQIAYLPLMPLVSEWLLNGENYRRRIGWVLGVSAFLTLIALFQALLLFLPIPPRADISTRLHGWKQMGAAIRAFDERTGRRFFFVGQGAPLTALIAFYGCLAPDRIAEVNGAGHWHYWWGDRVLAVDSDVAYIDTDNLSEVDAWKPLFKGPITSETHQIISNGKFIRTIRITSLTKSLKPIVFTRTTPFP